MSDLQFPLIDLRTMNGTLTDNDNCGILDMLSQLIELTKKQKACATGKEKASHSRRLTSFMKGYDAISSYCGKIVSGQQAKKEIKGVGAGIAKRIDEYLKNGYLEELRVKADPYADSIKDLCSVTGIGEVKAKQLIDEFNIKSVPELIEAYHNHVIKVEKNQLTKHIEVGIKFYDDLKTRMPWSEADKIANKIIKIIFNYDNIISVRVCGSYRRKKETCGDLDILISHPDNACILTKIVDLLSHSGLLVGHLTHQSKTKYMGVCRLNDSLPGRRIDIRLVDHQSMGAATLYFTGSGKFNKIMRYKANERGYTLNEYGLYNYINRQKGDLIPAYSEREIFDILNIKYLEPEERDF
jgi:DNA polymerase/3'-5' exonuclease PolX